MKKNKYRWGLCLLLFLMLLMTIVLLRKCDIQQLTEILQRANPYPLLTGIAMVFTHLLLGAAVIYLILHSLGQPCGYLKSIKYACVDVYYAAVTPSATGGQPAQLYYMTKDGVTAPAATLLLLLITVVYKVVLLLLSLAAVVLDSDFVFGINKVVSALFLLGIVINVVVVIFCLMLMFSKRLLKSIVTTVVHFLAKCKLMRRPEKWLTKFENSYREYHAGAQYIKEHYGITVRVTVITVFQRVALFSVAFCVYLALGGHRFSYFDFMTIQIVIATAVDSMPFPGGAGLAETLYTLIYKKVFPGFMILPAMILTRGISFYLYFIICAIGSFTTHVQLMSKERREQKKKEAED